MNKCTIYKDIYSLKDPHYISVDAALERIRVGKSAERVSDVRKCIDKDRANKIKVYLPSVCFSGVFEERKDTALKEHSGFICLDFDSVDDVQVFKKSMSEKPFVYAAWVSPSGNGIKCLVRIADTSKHRDHFEALKEDFPDVDKSGINESRVCYESHDPEIFLNKGCSSYTKLKKYVQVVEKDRIQEHGVVFDNILKWLAKKGDAFRKGERNLFMFKLASACCRYGIPENYTERLCTSEFPVSSDFMQSELANVIKSAYRTSSSVFGTAYFDRDVLVTKATRKEVEIDASIYDMSVKAKDVVYGEDCKENARDIFMNGYPTIVGIGCKEIDDAFKLKRGELTGLSGIGGYGKTTWLKWMLMIHAAKHGSKFAIFGPEDFPSEGFYHGLAEMYIGRMVAGGNHNISMDTYNKAYDFVAKHFFYVHPQEKSPTPEYVKERFLELIIKEKVDGVVIDPFNQLDNNYGNSGGRSDKYLESFLGDMSRFALTNDIYFFIVMHPHKLQKGADGNYPCPDIFDLADGAMWNNKLWNMLVYHRPYASTIPTSPDCYLAVQKVKKNKVVGTRGAVVNMMHNYVNARFIVDGVDVLGDILGNSTVSIAPPKEVEMREQPKGFSPLKPSKKFTPPQQQAGFESRELDDLDPKEPPF